MGYGTTSWRLPRRGFDACAPLTWLVVAVIALGGALPTQAQQGERYNAATPMQRGVDEAKVAQVKSAYLVNFLRFTRWPDESFETSTSPLTIVVLGDDTLGDVLNTTVRNVRIGDRGVAVRRVRWPQERDYRTREAYEVAIDAAMERIRSGHLLYLTPSCLGHARSTIAAVNGEALLTVGDGMAFMHDGAMLGLTLDDDRIIFYANQRAIDASPLTVSSRLLQLARIYESRE